MDGFDREGTTRELQARGVTPEPVNIDFGFHIKDPDGAIVAACRGQGFELSRARVPNIMDITQTHCQATSPGDVHSGVVGAAALIGAQRPGREAVHLLRVPHGGIQPSPTPI